MCGIAGAVALRPDARPDRDRVLAMSACVAHRGPDGEGLWTAPSGRAILAHRRLSVIDLATGAQPMTAADDAAGLVFNGEIYNYRELRDELRAEGYRFRTESDTEVLLALARTRGARAVEALRGMFAFAYWDDRTGRLLVARDRVGKKPFYYAAVGGCLYFASSLGALRAAMPAAPALDVEALDLYLTLAYIPAPRTIYRGIWKLPAGTVVDLAPGSVVGDGDALATRTFWDLAPDTTQFVGTFDDAVERTDALLGEAVRLRLRSDVPLGVFLSGGIDSSLITALAVRHGGRGVPTFSIGFDDADAGGDESEYAAQVARHLGTEHHAFRVRTELFDLLPQLVAQFGEPYADASAMPTSVLARHTRAHVTVALGGDGGDEGFAGYAWYRTAARLARIPRGVPAAAAGFGVRVLAAPVRGAGAITRRAGQLQRGLRMLAIDDGAERFAALRSLMSPADAALLYTGELRAVRQANPRGLARPLLREAYERCAGSPSRRMRYTDICTYLADDLLPKVDVATMAFGLEARAPLLDQEVLQFALSLPDEYLYDEGGGKRVLRALLGRYVPPHLFERPKQGFSVPLRRWFAGSLRGSMQGLAGSERLRALGCLQPAGIARLVEEHTRGIRDHGDRLYSLLILDEWLKQRSSARKCVDRFWGVAVRRRAAA